MLRLPSLVNELKNQSFIRRLAFAWNGIRFAYARERSVRTQCLCALAMLLLLCVLRPATIWWALCALATGLVLGLEMLNTALEQALDRLHPEQHESVRMAKDCAAGAVLIASCVAGVIGLLTVLAAFGLV